MKDLGNYPIFRLHWRFQERSCVDLKKILNMNSFSVERLDGALDEFDLEELHEAATNSHGHDEQVSEHGHTEHGHEVLHPPTVVA